MVRVSKQAVLNEKKNKTDLVSLAALPAVCVPASCSTDKSIRSTTQKLQSTAPNNV